MPPARTVYGRRRARPLRRARAEALDGTLPRVSLPDPLQPDALSDPASLFAAPVDQVWLEVGFGNGEHLLGQASTNSGVGIIGCEPFMDGVAALLKDLPAALEPRVRLYTDDARHVLDGLPDSSLDRAFVLFPDPWPKSRHHRRRFIQTDTVAFLARVLKPGSELRVASDDAPLVDWMLARIRRDGRFRWLAKRADDWRVRPDDWPETRYEKKRLHGVPVFMRFERV